MTVASVVEDGTLELKAVEEGVDSEPVLVARTELVDAELPKMELVVGTMLTVVLLALATSQSQ